MGKGILFIDAASLTNAIGAVTSCENSHDWTEWEYRCINQVTGSFLLNRFLEIAPGPQLSYNPSPKSAQSDLYVYADFLSKEMAHNIGFCTIKERIRDSALDDFKIWVKKDLNLIKNNIYLTKREESFPFWMDWTVEKIFPDHASRLNGLFDIELIEELSSVLETKQRTLQKLWKKIHDEPEIVKKWSNGKNQNDDFDLAKDAYVVAAILRGRLHEQVSRLSDHHITHHPLRDHILPSSNGGISYKIPPPTTILSNMIIGSAMEEIEPLDRVKLWSENVKKIQTAYINNEIPELNSDDDGEALETAKKIARKIELRLHTRLFEDCLDHAFIWGAAVLTSFGPSLIIHPWDYTTGFAGSIGLSYYTTPIRKKVAGKIKLRDGRLNELAKTPGRVVYTPRNVKNAINRLP